MPQDVSLGSSGVLLFDGVDLLAGIAVVAVGHTIRVHFGLRWWNSLQEIETPVYLLVAEVTRRWLQPTTKGMLGYGLILVIVTIYWMLGVGRVLV